MREKLIELLKEDTCPGLSYEDCAYCKYDGEHDCFYKSQADHLIANGVTVQELEGCDFCQKFDFAGARVEVNKYGAHISLAICNTKFPNEELFKFCPMCGRRLPQPPKGE